MKHFLSFLYFVFFVSFLSAQERTIQVLDRQTENPVSFTKINDGEESTFITDIDGKVKMNIVASRSYTFRFFDYKDTVISGHDLLNNPVVFLSAQLQVFGEVVVLPGENPAHRMIQNVMDNKQKNDPMKNNAFTYESYSKMYFTGELKEGLIRDTVKDSSNLELLEFLDRQYFFLTETKANRTFIPPAYDKEVVSAYNVSGVKMPVFATLVNQFQSFSFYDNNFELNQKEYINPIAPGGLRRYLFILEDTLLHEGTNDTTFTISFRPRKGKNFVGLDGFLYVNTKDWAIERVIASPTEQQSFYNVKIIQEYRYTNDLKWFPHKISTELEFNKSFFSISPEDEEGEIMNNIIGRSSLYIKNVHFDSEELTKRKSFNPVAVEVEEGALTDSVSLREARGETATGKEEATYVVIDSIAKEANIERQIQLLRIAATGVIPIWKLGIPIDKIITYNPQEGYRLGLGLETNERLSQHLKLGGYFAYGFRDKAWKWGGDLSILLHKKNLVKLKLHYSDDLHERGGTDFYRDAFNLTNQDYYRSFFINKWDRERYVGINLSGLIRQNMKIQAFGNYKRFSFVDAYQFHPLLNDKAATAQFDIAEAGIVFNWNIREKVMILENQRVSLGTKWPKITLKAVRGFKGVFDANYDYYRFNLTLNQDFKVRGVGEIHLVSKSGWTLGNIPLTLSQVAEGTGSDKALSLSAKNTFQTMLASEFFSDRYSSFFFRFEFLPLKNKTKWTEPVFGIHSAAGIGTMQNRTDHKFIDFKIPEKGYYESGVTIDNLLKYLFTGYGVGVFYRYGPYELPKTADNFFYKFTLKINL